MLYIFSKRHQDDLKSLPLSFPLSLRVTISRILEMYSPEPNYGSSTIDEAEEILKTALGEDPLLAFDNNDQKVPAHFREVILRGYPSKVLDAIEAWFAAAGADEERFRCEEDLNTALAVNRSPWRIAGGKAILVNSEYVRVEIYQKLLRLLDEGKILGVLDEFNEALQHLSAGRYKEAVVSAHKSVESVMKVVLGVEKGRFGQLLRELVNSEVIPLYYEEFYKHFEKLALGVVKERNREGRGHGQGAKIKPIDRTLAEFAVNLAGSINLFLLQQTRKQRKESFLDDEIPF